MKVLIWANTWVANYNASRAATYGFIISDHPKYAYRYTNRPDAIYNGRYISLKEFWE